ncbi:MAG: glycosyltransferase family 2 protein [Candidatus Falkowbacteria bacterium]
MDLSVIIVSWNTRDKLAANLASLYSSQGDFSFEVFVVDNGSADGSAEMVKRQFAQVKLIANKKNLGFAKANNLALKKAKGEWLLLLNPDMKLKPDTLSNFLNWVKKNKPAIAGCKLVDSQGRLVRHVRRFPTLFDQAIIAMKLAHLMPSLLGRYLYTDFDYSKAAQVDSIRGSFFAISRSTYKKLGGLDERYFIWFEEVDYCRQAREAGLAVWYTPAAEAVDLIGQGFKQVGHSVKQRYMKQSMIKYFAKWQGGKAAWAIRLAWLFGSAVNLIGKPLGLKSRTNT